MSGNIYRVNPSSLCPPVDISGFNLPQNICSVEVVLLSTENGVCLVRMIMNGAVHTIPELDLPRPLSTRGRGIPEISAPSTPPNHSGQIVSAVDVQSPISETSSAQSIEEADVDDQMTISVTPLVNESADEDENESECETEENGSVESSDQDGGGNIGSSTVSPNICVSNSDSNTQSQWEVDSPMELPQPQTLHGRPKRGAIESYSPFQVLSMLWTQELFDLIAKETNVYAQQNLTQNGREWNNTTMKEIIGFHGMVIAMAIARYPREEMYWQSKCIGAIALPDFGTFMKLGRFKELKRNLHVADNSVRAPRGVPGFNKLYHVQPIINVLRERFAAEYICGTHVSVDEAIVPWKGKMSPIRVYMKDKPHKWGTKIWCLNDSYSSYCAYFDVYTGRRVDGRAETGLGKNVVLNLMGQLPTEPKRVVFCDRFFTSVSLCREANDVGHYVVGTIMANRVNECKEVILPRNSKAQRGTTQFAIHKEDKIAVVSWMDKRPVNFIGTAYGPKHSTTLRKGRSGESQSIQCPCICVQYNKGMGGTDTFDQLRLSRYSIETKVITMGKWWTKLYWGLFDMALTNAYVIYKYFNAGVSHLDFLMKLQGQMVNMMNGNTPQPVANRTRNAVENKSYTKPNTLDPSQTRFIPSIRHLLYTPNKGKQRCCVVCMFGDSPVSGDKKRVRRVVKRCKECGDVPLCEGFCDEYFHSNRVKGYDDGHKRRRNSP